MRRRTPERRRRAYIPHLAAINSHGGAPQSRETDFPGNPEFRGNPPGNSPGTWLPHPTSREIGCRSQVPVKFPGESSSRGIPRWIPREIPREIRAPLPDCAVSPILRQSEEDKDGQEHRRQENRVWRHGDSNKPLLSSVFDKQACFGLPMGSGDKLGPGSGQKLMGTPQHRPSCALFELRLDLYQNHMAACDCSREGCWRMGLSFETKSGAMAMCSLRSKEQIHQGREVAPLLRHPLRGEGRPKG